MQKMDPNLLSRHTASIYSLPDEILGEIFLAACSDRKDLDILLDHPYQKVPQTTNPFSFGAVCSEWRDAVLSTPHMWTDISLVLSAEAERRGHRESSLLSHHLTHSGSLPLTIKLRFKDEKVELQYATLPPDDIWRSGGGRSFVQLLASSAPRWHTIDMVIPPNWYFIFRDKSHSFNNLQSARLRPPWVDNVRVQVNTVKVLDFFKDAPKLRNLRLGQYALPDRQVQFTWSHLTRLTLQKQHLVSCCQTLELATQLTWVRLVSPYLHPEDYMFMEQRSREIHLRRLGYLTIEKTTWKDHPFFQFLFSVISCPALHCLELISTKIDLEQQLPSTFSQPDTTRITRLLLTVELAGSHQRLLDFLREMHHLEDLELHIEPDYHLYHTFFKRLLLERYPAQGTTYALPNLVKFGFSGPVVLRNSSLDSAFVKILYFRRLYYTSPTTLTKLRVFIFETGGICSISEERKKLLNRLVEEGLELKVICGGSSWF